MAFAHHMEKLSVCFCLVSSSDWPLYTQPINLIKTAVWSFEKEVD